MCANDWCVREAGDCAACKRAAGSICRPEVHEYTEAHGVAGLESILRIIQRAIAMCRADLDALHYREFLSHAPTATEANHVPLP